MSDIPEPLNWDSVSKEPFADYWLRWPAKYSHVPEVVADTWIHRHWQQFRGWRGLKPESWTYEMRRLTAQQVLTIGDVSDPKKDGDEWGYDLIEGIKSGECWLRDYMLANGTTPAPILIAESAGHVSHPHHDGKMAEPFQLIEGHRRLALLKAMIRLECPNLQSHHEVAVARIPELELP